MRLRQAILFSLFVANIMILVHSVIPHHHHINQICLEGSLCNQNESNQPDFKGKDSHKHGSNNSEPCVLEQYDALPAHNIRFDYILSTPSSADNSANQLLAIQNYNFSDAEGYLQNINSILLLRSAPFANSFFDLSYGMRGPPVI